MLDDDGNEYGEYEQSIMDLIAASVLSDQPTGLVWGRQEWARLREGKPDANSFDGDPSHYDVDVNCPHCGEIWNLRGWAFGKVSASTHLAFHVAWSCEAVESCVCWDIDSANDPSVRELGLISLPRCQACGKNSEACECPDGTTYGPCAEIALLEKLWES